MNPYERAREAGRAIRERIGADSVDIALVLGSGWATAADAIGTPHAEFPAADIPGFMPPAAAGHGGTIRSVQVGTQRVLIFLGRTHFYEQRNVADVCHGVRAAAAAGARTVVLTNGCGGINPSWAPGTPVLIRDHINLTAASPIMGANFVDLTDLYSHRLRDLCRVVDQGLPEGVYVQLPGPHYETPAEIAMLSVLGGDLVGMSTALEAIAAREAGMEVMGLSLVTNQAAGLSGAALDHADVLAAGDAAASGMGDLLSNIVPKM